MEVKINREIRNYTESMFFGLSLRQCVFSLLTMVVAVGLYFLLKPHVGSETVSWMQEKYITITVTKKDVEEARAYFARVGAAGFSPLC